MSDIIKQLHKVAQDVSEINEDVSNEIYDVADEYENEDKKTKLIDELNNVADELEDLEENVLDNVDNALDGIEEVADLIEECDDDIGINNSPSAKIDIKTQKQASLINEGDKVVCLNPIQGIYKGRIYLVVEKVDPNYIVIKEESGEDVGIFDAGRFCLDYRTY